MKSENDISSRGTCWFSEFLHANISCSFLNYVGFLSINNWNSIKVPEEDNADLQAEKKKKDFQSLFFLGHSHDNNWVTDKRKFCLYSQISVEN